MSHAIPGQLCVRDARKAAKRAGRLRKGSEYAELAELVRGVARHTHEIAARNAARLGDVDHRPDHPFLFNCFFADDTDTLLQVWEYTAGWFQVKTSLPNSTLLQPLAGEPDDYGIVNHASWPRLRTFLPSLLFRPTFRSRALPHTTLARAIPRMS